MRSVNPLKLREFLAAAGLPVVSVDIPEVRVLAEQVFLARNAEDFVTKIEQALKQNTPERQRQRSESVKSESWTARVALVEQKLQVALDIKTAH